MEANTTKTQAIEGEVVSSKLGITPSKLKDGSPNIIVRDEHGRLISGALNPGGKSYKRLIRQVLKEDLENGEAVPVAKELLRLARKAKHESARIAAIQAVIEHTEGKATQQVRFEHTMDANTLARIAELADRLQLT